MGEPMPKIESDAHASTRAVDETPLRRAASSLGATAFLRLMLDDLTIAGAAGGDGRAAPRGPNPVAPDVEDQAGATHATLGDVAERLDERAFGLMLLLLALPCCLPFVYGLPQIVAFPMLALAGQMAAGRAAPWLPARLAGRRFEIAGFRKTVDRAERYLGWVEKIARPRLAGVTSRLGARVTGALLLIPCASILVPLPGTNTAPGLGVAIAAVGVVERDGVLVILGAIVGLAWVAFLATFGLEAASLLKDWVGARF